MIGIPIQPVYTSQAGRESALPQGLDRGQTAPQPAASVSVVAVKPAAKSEASARAADDKSREKESSKDRQPASGTPSAGKHYDRRVVYEREFKRTFIDVVDRDDKDERLMRIPSEKLVRFIEDMKGPSSADDNAPRRRLDAIV